MHLNVSYNFLPKEQTSHTAMVMSHFGIGFETGKNVIADDLDLPIQAGEVVCFTGSSGSGKSSLMRAAAAQLNKVINIDELDLGEKCLIDGLECPFEEAMRWLSLCGLSEAQLMLRTPAELSDGQRYRFRLAKGLSLQPEWLLADEFTATLDRVLARVIAFNVRKLASRERTGFLLATTHEDILDDLQPDLHVRCDLGGELEICRPDRKKKSLSLLSEFELSTGTKSDWSYFARWHYRSHNVGFVRFVTLLWHGEKPVGICVFSSGPLCLSQRNRFFGLTGRLTKLKLSALNKQIVMLSRVVIHPAYRGAGIAPGFVNQSCRLCPSPWIETQSQMGWINPFFEKAGFIRVGYATAVDRSRRVHSGIYGGDKRRHGQETLLSRETHNKSRFAEPVYYIFDNRDQFQRHRTEA